MTFDLSDTQIRKLELRDAIANQIRNAGSIIQRARESGRHSISPRRGLRAWGYVTISKPEPAKLATDGLRHDDLLRAGCEDGFTTLSPAKPAQVFYLYGTPDSEASSGAYRMPPANGLVGL